MIISCRRPLKLHELLEYIENVDDIPTLPDGIVMYPPEDANAIVTDEDSGDDDNVTISNLPGGQLRSKVEILFDKDPPGRETEEEDSEDDLPLSTIKNNLAYVGQITPTAKTVYEDDKSEDDIPITSKNRKHPKPKPKPLSWTKQDLGLKFFGEFVDDYGPVNNLTPLQLFECFFDKAIISLILNYSNMYAAQKNEVGDISNDELMCFIGVLILSGYVVLPRRQMFWENLNDTRNTTVTSAISRDRFNFIMRNIHCCNNNDLQKDDKFAKVRPLMNKLNEKFIEFAPLQENHSIDESMIPYYGRHSCKQFIRGKPIRWGYKFWTATTRLGYVNWFDPYQGASTTLPTNYKSMGLGSSVILQYADVLHSRWQNMPFHLFFDNFFTCIPLLSELENRGLKATGTVRENRTGKCPLSDSKKMKKTTRGTFELARSDNGIIICKWNDNSVVNVASNSLQVYPTNLVKRYSHKEKRKVNIEQPSIIKTYNINMGGVDRCDQNISLYRISIRGKKWYFPLICHCIDMALQNAWQLHRINMGDKDQLSFRRAVAMNMLETYKKSTRRGVAKSSSLANEFSRYDRIDHLVIYQENQSRCGHCHKKVQFRCEKCQVALHPKQCFKLYHCK